MPEKFEDGLVLADEDTTPVADRVLRVIDGRIIASDEALTESEIISAQSVEQGPGSGLDADTVDGVEVADLAASPHAADHLQSGSDELDGDKVDIDVALTNITPDTTPAEVDDVSQLGAIIKGIDNILASATVNEVAMQVYDGLHSTSSSTYVTVARMVIDFDRLPTDTPEFSWQQAAVPATSTSVRLRNVTDGSNIFETTGITTTGLKTETATLPTGKKLCYLQHLRATGAGGGFSEIEGGTLHAG